MKKLLAAAALLGLIAGSAPSFAQTQATDVTAPVTQLPSAAKDAVKETVKGEIKSGEQAVKTETAKEEKALEKSATDTTLQGIKKGKELKGSAIKGVKSKAGIPENAATPAVPAVPSVTE